jgi:hypothetical protein
MYSNFNKALIVILFLFSSLLSGYSYSQLNEIVDITGTVKYMSIEGGFYGIAGDNGKNYDPIKLDKSFCAENLRVKVQGIGRNDLTSTHNWGTILEIKNIEIINSEPNVTDIKKDSPSEADYEVHEWGVMVGCANDKTFFNTSRPEIQTIVKQPVVYIHSNNKVPFSLKVTFNTGKPTSVYPLTVIDGNITEWNNIKFQEVNKGIRENPEIDTNNLRPLKEIMNTLNDVDADMLFYNKSSSNFLFYEGEMDFENKIEATYDAVKGEVTFKNNFPFDVNNVVYSSATGDFMHPHYICGKADIVKSNETAVVKLTNMEPGYWTKDLTSLGFSDREGNSFSRLWEGPFLEKTNQANWSNLIYRIPQEQLEKMITLEFNPTPKKVIRALYILISL